MLSVHNLACARGERRLFAGIDFVLQPGEWLHVRGENGAGKTSLLRILAGLGEAHEGEVRWRGEPIRRLAEDYHRDLFFLGHHGAVKEELSARENLRFAAEIDGAHPDEASIQAALRRFGLAGREDLPVRFFSAGQKRRTLLARLITRQAPLWILDEPFTALDVAAAKLLADLLAAHLEAGGLAVLTSHQALPLAGGKSVEL